MVALRLTQGAQGARETDEAALVQKRFERAWKGADFRLAASRSGT